VTIDNPQQDTPEDQIIRFTFADLPVRGQFVRLTRSWLLATEAQNYPDPVRQRVGQVMAVATLLADGIKFEGRVALQATSDGAITTLLGECAHQNRIRGIARLAEDGTSTSDALLGTGRLAISLIPDQGEMHQGVVELVGDSVASAVELYFANSEQLPTKIQLASDAQGITAVLLQRLPDSSPLPDGRILAKEKIDLEWERLHVLFDTCTGEELLTLQAERLLYRLFHEDRVTLTPPRTIAFGCSCSRQRSEAALKLLGKDDLTALSNETDEITISCEMCGALYSWDSVEAHVLFETQEPKLH